MRITKKDIRLSIYAFLLAFTATFLTSCETENYEFGDIINPSNLTLAADIVGADTENPYGDGSGTVNFTAVADGVITYKFVYNGTEYMRPSGVFAIDFTTTGIHIYEVAVVASGTAGIMTNGSIEVEVLVTYEPPAELVNALTTGSWRVKAEAPGHMGVGPADDQAPDGMALWWNANPFDKADTGMYDDRFIFSSAGNMTYQANGSIFGKAPPLETEFFGNQGLGDPNSDNEHQYYPVDDFDSVWTISEPGGVETLSFTGNGFLGFYVGGTHSYQILSRNSNTIYLKTIGWDDLSWFILITNEQ